MIAPKRGPAGDDGIERGCGNEVGNRQEACDVYETERVQGKLKLWMDLIEVVSRVLVGSFEG